MRREGAIQSVNFAKDLNPIEELRTYYLKDPITTRPVRR